ncbi:hypothetical protein CPC08DRAFT_704274 [Agrocybe pediades]|nr:hypothetical protein CPC08DRAFT_704274 [Agrocybe pediades]
MDSHHRNLNDTHPHHDDEDTYDPVRLPPTSHSIALQWLRQTRSTSYATSTHSEPADIYASSYDDDDEHLPSRTDARLTGDVKFDHLHDQHYHENDDRDSISSTIPQYHDHDNTSTSFDSDRAHATLTTSYANTNSGPGTSNANSNHAVSASASETSRTRDGRRRKIRRKRGSHDLRYEYHQENKE